MTEPEPTDRPSNRSTAEREGGDPACWLGQVCPECGRFTEQDSPKKCPDCGAEMPTE